MNSQDEDEVNEYKLYNSDKNDDGESGEDEIESRDGLRISKQTGELIQDIIGLFKEKD